MSENGNNSNNEKRCYTVDDLCRILMTSRQTVYNLLQKKEFRWIQLGGRQYRIPKKCFDEWLENQKN